MLSTSPILVFLKQLLGQGGSDLNDKEREDDFSVRVLEFHLLHPTRWLHEGERRIQRLSLAGKHGQKSQVRAALQSQCSLILHPWIQLKPLSVQLCHTKY